MLTRKLHCTQILRNQRVGVKEELLRRLILQLDVFEQLEQILSALDIGAGVSLLSHSAGYLRNLMKHLDLLFIEEQFLVLKYHF